MHTWTKQYWNAGWSLHYTEYVDKLSCGNIVQRFEICVFCNSSPIAHLFWMWCFVDDFCTWNIKQNKAQQAICYLFKELWIYKYIHLVHIFQKMWSIFDHMWLYDCIHQLFEISFKLVLGELRTFPWLGQNASSSQNSPLI